MAESTREDGAQDDGTRGAGAAGAGVPPVRLVVDFNRLHRRADGGASIAAGRVDAPEVAGLGLREGQHAIFEQPGELQMAGTLRRRVAADGVTAYWEGELDPASTTYHISVEPRALYFAGPGGCACYGEWVEVVDATGARRRETRPRGPTRLLTLGVEGTYEQWHRSLAFRTVWGESTFGAGEPVVLIDDAREVDARVHVLRLPPDAHDPEYPAGRRVWLAEPDWGTVRRSPWALPDAPDAPS